MKGLVIMYKPSITISNLMLSRTISIAEKLGKIETYHSLKRMPILRRNNKIRSIHSSLAIEANSLSLDEVRDVISGKVVIGPQKDIEADAGMRQLFPSSRLGLRAKPENVTIGQNKARKSRDVLPAFF